MMKPTKSLKTDTVHDTIIGPAVVQAVAPKADKTKLTFTVNILFDEFDSKSDIKPKFDRKMKMFERLMAQLGRQIPGVSTNIKWEWINV